MTNYLNYVKQLNKALPLLIKTIKKNNGGILKINLDTSKGLFFVLTDNGQYRYNQKKKVVAELTSFLAQLKDFSVYFVRDKQCYEVKDNTCEETAIPLVVNRGIVLTVSLVISELEDFFTEIIVMCHMLIKNTKNFFIELTLNNKIVLNNFTSEQELLTHHELLNLPLINMLSKQSLILSPIVKNKTSIEKDLTYLGKVKNFLLYSSNNGLFIINQDNYQRLLFRLKAEKQKNLTTDKELLLIPQKLKFDKSNSTLFQNGIKFLKNNGFNFNQAGDITSYPKLYKGINLQSVVAYLMDVSDRQQQIDWETFSQKVVFLSHEIDPYEVLDVISKIDFKKYHSQLHDVMRMIDMVYLERLFDN